MVICSECSAVLGIHEDVCPRDGAKAKTLDELPVGGVLGEYKIDKKLGEGGMGFVYEATHGVLHRRSALKVLRPEFATNEAVVTRFLQEAKAVNLINHRHIVNVYDYGDDIDGLVYFVMEYLEGETLGDLVHRRDRLSPALWLHTFTQIAKGLAAAHKKDIVHRDLKPENIFVIARSGNPLFIKLLDFGVAKLRGEGKVEGLTGTGVLIGTPQFMSPEQFRGQPVTPSSDVFSLGIIMYYAITGKMPFPGTEISELALGIIKEEPEPVASLVPNTPGSILKIIKTCLQKEPEQRYSTATELLKALGEVHQEIDADNQEVTAALRQHACDADLHIEPVLDSSWTTTASPKGKTRARAKQASPNASKQKPLIAIAAIALLLAAGGTALLISKSGSSAQPSAGPQSTTQTATPNHSPSHNLLDAFHSGELGKLKVLAAGQMQSLWETANADSRVQIVEALGNVGSKLSLPILEHALAESPQLQVEAAKAIAALRDPSAKDALSQAMQAAGAGLKVDLAVHLFTLGDNKAKNILEAALKQQGKQVVAALALVQDASSTEAEAILRSTFTEVPPWKGRWLESAEGLLILDDAAAREILLKTLVEGKDEGHKVAAATLLATQEIQEGLQHLSDTVADARSEHREGAAVALARLNHPDALLYVPVGMMSDVPREKISAIASLSLLGGEDLHKQAERLIKLVEDESVAAIKMAALAAIGNLEK